MEHPKVFGLINWWRERDSNPRYSVKLYNGLANRRLQPLGHLSDTFLPYTNCMKKKRYKVKILSIFFVKDLIFDLIFLPSIFPPSHPCHG